MLEDHHDEDNEGRGNRHRATQDASSITLSGKINFVRQIWLAGLGAYGHSVNELTIAGDKSSSVFSALVSRGQTVDDVFKLYTSQQHISLISLERLMNSTYGKLTGGDAQKIDRLSSKIDALILLLQQELPRPQANSQQVRRD